MNRNHITLCAWLLLQQWAAVVPIPCAASSRTPNGQPRRRLAATETVDVKSALIADGRVDASNINVDTIASTKTVVLKGSVPTAQQRTTAEEVARAQAKGYTITNQLTIAAK